MTNRETRHQLIRDQLAAHIPYEQAEGIAQLSVLGHQETLKQAISSTSEETKVRHILDRINQLGNE